MENQNADVRIVLEEMRRQFDVGLRTGELLDQKAGAFLVAAGSGPRDLALVAFIADTACRCAGAAGARLSELDIDRRAAVVREKGQKQRTVFFGSETASALLQWLDVRPPDPSDALFVNWRDGGFLSPTGVYQVFKRLARAAGLIDDGRRYNPHSLRHAWARRALQAGMDLGTVSEIMGHTGIEVTARFYARWADRELQERKEAYSRPLQVPVPAMGAQPDINGGLTGRQPGGNRASLDEHPVTETHLLRPAGRRWDSNREPKRNMTQ